MRSNHEYDYFGNVLEYEYDYFPSYSSTSTRTQKVLVLEYEYEYKYTSTITPSLVDTTQTGSKKIKFQHELRNQFETLQKLDDIDTLSETITDMIQQSMSRVAKAINKPLPSRISSPTRGLMMKQREMVEYAEIGKIIKKKARADIRR